MARTNNGPQEPTRGGQLLAKGPDTEREIAERVGVDNSLVDRWINGQRKPTDEQIATIEQLYGIPPSAWSEAPLTRRSAASLLPPRLQRLAREGFASIEGDDDEIERAVLLIADVFREHPALVADVLRERPAVVADLLEALRKHA